MSLCLCLSALGQMESRLSFRRYTTQDGLPQMQTERLFQDARGYIYIGTLSGFVRFDGKTFTPFLKGRRFNIVGFGEVNGTVSAFDFRRQWLTDFDGVTMRPISIDGGWLLNNFNSGSLPNGYVLLEDEHEAHRRLCRMTGNGFDDVLADTLMDLMTPDRRLYMDSTSVFVPTEQGLFCLDTKGRELLSAKPDVFTLLRTKDGLLAFASDGIYLIRGVRGDVKRETKSLSGETESVSGETESVNGGSENAGSDCLELLTPFNFTSVNYGLIVKAQANGHLIIADEHTLYGYDGQRIVTVATGFNLVKDLLVDRWDRLWVATYEGLYCYFNRCFTVHRLTDSADIVRSVAVDGHGRLVMGTLNGKLLTMTPGEQPIEHASLTIVDDTPDNYFAPNAAVVKGSVYMAGNGDVACVGDSTLHWLRLPYDRYQFVAPAGERLIIGSRRCITAYDPTSGSIDTLSTDTPYPWCAAQDNSQRLWVGTTFGLYCDGRKHDYTQQLIVTTMERDPQGNILFASKDSLFVIRNGQVEPLPMPELSGHEVRSLHLSPKGFLVVAAIDGLFVSRIDAGYTITHVRFFDHRNGFTMIEPLQATMTETDDGTVWLPGLEEMTSFRPEELLAYDEADTYIAPPLRWWQHWWVWVIGLVLLALAVWAVTRWYEKRRHRRRLIRLEHEKQQREALIHDIRQKAIDEAKANVLAQDIVKMTERNDNERITLRTASGTMVVDVKDIACFKGDGNYSQIVTFHGTSTVLTGLGALEKTLNSDVFVRADRSTLVNIHHISSLMPKQRRCIFRSPSGVEVETTLLAPAFKRLQRLIGVRS